MIFNKLFAYKYFIPFLAAAFFLSGNVALAAGSGHKAQPENTMEAASEKVKIFAFDDAPNVKMPGDIQPNHITIGSHLPLTGTMASVGKEQKWSYEKALDDLNNRYGGIYIAEYNRVLPVKMIILDDKSTPAGAVAATHDLITKYKADVILGGHTAAFGVIPGCITAEKYHKYYHATGSFTQPWLEHNFKWSTLMFVDIELQSKMPFEILERYKAKEIPIKTVGIFMENTYDGKAMGMNARKHAAEYGYVVSMEEYCLVSDNRSLDYKAQILKAKALNIDAIILFANTTPARDLVLQMQEYDFTPKIIFGFKGFWNTEFQKTMTGKMDYLISDAHWHDSLPFSGSRELGEDFYEQFGKYSLSAGMFYATVETLYLTIRECASLDSAKIRKAVGSMIFDTIIGPVSYDSRGLALLQPMAVEFIDNKPRLIYPLEYVNLQTPAKNSASQAE